MQQHRIELPGLNAANLLAYMAALGTLRALSLSGDPRLSWTDEHGWWMPIIQHPEIASREDLVAQLEANLSRDMPRPWGAADDLTMSVDQFRELALRCADAARPTSRVDCDFVAAFGSEACATGPKADMIADTEFRTMSGAGHQHFLGFMRELRATTTQEHLQSSLFSDWEYGDSKPSMRWDPNDYRPHALRAEDPSTDPIRTMRGANRLAIEALPLFPTMPTVWGLRTTAFTAGTITYPVWSNALDCESVRSLLALDYGRRAGETEVAIGVRSATVLRGRSITALFEAERFTEGKYRNFSPSRQVL